MELPVIYFTQFEGLFELGQKFFVVETFGVFVFMPGAVVQDDDAGDVVVFVGKYLVPVGDGFLE